MATLGGLGFELAPGGAGNAPPSAGGGGGGGGGGPPPPPARGLGGPRVGREGGGPRFEVAGDPVAVAVRLTVEPGDPPRGGLLGGGPGGCLGFVGGGPEGIFGG